MRNPADESGLTNADLVQMIRDARREIAALNEKMELLREKPRSHNEYWLSPGETAQRLGVSTRTLINRRLRGEIPANCWSKENIRYYSYRESWVEQARRVGIKSARSLFEAAA